MSVDLRDNVRRSLAIIHADVNTCRMCESLVSNFRKPVSMYRGEPGQIAIVGQEPGNREITNQRAFSGPSGQRLDKWLIASGFDPEDPRKRIYTTSVAKCLCDDNGLPLLRKNCFRFLEMQLRTIRPRLIISLGAVAYNAVRFSRINFNLAVCSLHYSTAQDAGFRTKFGFDYTLIVWPHPSPVSRWHNSPDNRKRLRDSFDVLRAHVADTATDEESAIV